MLSSRSSSAAQQIWQTLTNRLDTQITDDSAFCLRADVRTCVHACVLDGVPVQSHGGAPTDLV